MPAHLTVLDLIIPVICCEKRAGTSVAEIAAIWKEIDNKEKASLLFSQVGGWGIKRYKSFRTPAYKHPNHGINFAQRFLQYILLKSAYTVLRVTT